MRHVRENIGQGTFIDEAGHTVIASYIHVYIYISWIYMYIHMYMYLHWIRHVTHVNESCP